MAIGTLLKLNELARKERAKEKARHFVLCLIGLAVLIVSSSLGLALAVRSFAESNGGATLYYSAPLAVLLFLVTIGLYIVFVIMPAYWEKETP